MTRTGKRFLWLVLGLTLVLILCCHAASAASNGTWGGLNWELNDDGVLTISGSGGMTDFSYNTTQAWLADKNEITNVIIQEGVTSIGSCAFNKCSNLLSANIPVGVTSIGYSCLDLF